MVLKFTEARCKVFWWSQRNDPLPKHKNLFSYQKRRSVMGDKGGKKDKEKTQKQNNQKQNQKDKKKADKQPIKKS
jgi:hypothetical protein